MTYCNLCRAETPHRRVLSHWDNNYYVDKEIYSLVQCQACGVAEIENKPRGDALARYYARDYYSYDTSRSVFARMKAAAVRLAAGLPAPLAARFLLDDLYALAPRGGDAAVLDVGCGDGSALRRFRALGFTRLYGTEIDPARRPALERQGIHLFVTSDLTQAPLPESSFDVVRLSHVLEHVENPYETIERCRRLLKQGGRLLVAVPNFDSPARAIFGRYFCGLQLPTHLYHFGKANLRQLLATHGFVVKSLYTTGYSGFAASLLTLLKDKFGVSFPRSLSAAVILSLAPLDAAFDLLGLGYITTVEAVKP